MKKYTLSLLLVLGIFSVLFAKSTTNNFFIKGTYKKEGISLSYSGVIRFNTSSSTNYTTTVDFNFYLASFYIEEIIYKGITYNNHELFGYTFPKEMLSKINIEGAILFKNSKTTFTTRVSSFDKTKYALNAGQIEKLTNVSNNLKAEIELGEAIQFELLKTNEIQFPINKLFVNNLIQAIASNKALKTKEEEEKEYLRLLTEGNIFLGENNYKEALISYSLAKKYTTSPKNIIAKIGVVEGYIANNNRTKYRWENKQTAQIISDKKEKNEITRINYETDFNSKKNKEKYLELETEASKFLVKNKYDQAIVKFTEARKYTTKKTAIDEKIKVIKKFKAKELLLAGVIVKNKPNEKIKNEEENNRPIKEVVLQKKNTNYEPKKAKVSYKLNNDNQEKVIEKIDLSDNKETALETPKSKEVTVLENKAKKLKQEFGVESYRKGYIKYKRDEQAVLDIYNNILIPFGKYEILRYRAGFANIKIKDTVALKKIECTGKNDEYSWSARIYQNPWIETVVDGGGKYVDQLNKRVEIYVVDNVSLLPWDEVPQSVKDAYKDPNQYAGTDFVSAFKLWEHENANKPEIIARRKEIQNFKDASKNEAYKGADKCKEKVAKSIEEVYNYYKDLGYKIRVKY